VPVEFFLVNHCLDPDGTHMHAIDVESMLDIRKFLLCRRVANRL